MSSSSSTTSKLSYTSSSSSDSETDKKTRGVTDLIKHHITLAQTALHEKLPGQSDDDSSNSESEVSDNSEEDEDGAELTPAVDAAILRTLAKIKNKDPEIYSKERDVFAEERKKSGVFVERYAQTARENKNKQDKPLTLKQAHISSALNLSSRSRSPSPFHTHAEEQKALRAETIAAFHLPSNDDGDADDDDLLIAREKTVDEQELEEEKYRLFLEREVGRRELETLFAPLEDTNITPAENAATEIHDELNVKKKKKKKKKGLSGNDGMDTQSDPHTTREEADQEFLMNYVLNRGWIDRSTSRVPTYSEVTFKPDPSPNHEDDEQHSEFDDLAENFELSYNHRFLEPSFTPIIPSHPRQLPSLLRREDTKRKEARARRKERKQAEKEKKKEEVRKEQRTLKQKLEILRMEGGGKQMRGNEELMRELEDDEEEWDAERFDKRMWDVYGEGEQEQEYTDDGKPSWAVDDQTAEYGTNASVQKNKKKKKKRAESVDDGVDVSMMDADNPITVGNGGFDMEDEWDGTEEMRKRKLDEYMESLYALEFNDLIGGMPTRFKYAQVEPISYALSAAEILAATDAELNQYIPVKKYATYRDRSDRWDRGRVDRLKELKGIVGERAKALFGEQDSKGGFSERVKKRKGKKERLKEKQDIQIVEAVVAPEPNVRDEVGQPSTKRRKRKKSTQATTTS